MMNEHDPILPPEQRHYAPVTTAPALASWVLLLLPVYTGQAPVLCTRVRPHWSDR